MPIVFLPPPLLALTGGRASLEVEGATVGELIENLDRTWPGLRDRLLDGGRLRPHIRVAVDGRISPMGLFEKVSPASEVHFVTAVSGG
ncbi:MAG: MoaD/ThiS family protein [Bryobacterales bacterium]|nr:MoaD/ThiS family protein [Bryobacteraceae bacterium]MDW8129581.1 MoaD/ThiS family protein [Bryobacterales bacterium]